MYKWGSDLSSLHGRNTITLFAPVAQWTERRPSKLMFTEL